MATVNREDLLTFQSTIAGGHVHYFGVKRGSPSSESNVATSSLKANVDGFLTRTQEIEGSNLLPAEAGRRKNEQAGVMSQKLNADAKKIAEIDAGLRRRMDALPAVKTYEQVGYAEQQIDFRLLDKHVSRKASERAAIEHEMRNLPTVHWRLAEAFLRLPRELTGLDNVTHASIRVGILKATRAQEFETLEEERLQLENARAGLQKALEISRLVTGSTVDAVTNAPDALRYLQTTEPIEWVPGSKEPGSA